MGNWGFGTNCAVNVPLFQAWAPASVTCPLTVVDCANAKTGNSAAISTIARHFNFMGLFLGSYHRGKLSGLMKALLAEIPTLAFPWDWILTSLFLVVMYFAFFKEKRPKGR